ncbi:hypothetical protein RND81_02G234600 [Saponaria officinalis]|uniref:Zinc finger, CCHC-type n=1 Tax=Saponaria officinalis TaxID=3572 RepID=A0AAW1MWT4_SAPOF
MSNVKEMTTKFGKLDKFEGVDFRRWQKKMYFLLTTLKVVYVLSTPMPELVDDSSIEELRKKNKWENDDYIYSLFDIYRNVESAKELWNALLESKYMDEDESIFVSSIIDKFPPSWKDFKHMLKHKNEELSLVQLSSHLRIDESLRAQEGGNKLKGKEAMDPSSINMVERW